MVICVIFEECLETSAGLPVYPHGLCCNPFLPLLALTALQRGYTEDHSQHSTDRRSQFKQKGPQARSMDDTHLHVERYGKSGMHRGSSDTNLAAEFLAVPEKEKSGSKFSLIDKFADVSKAIQDKQGTKNRSKSPFAIFKKNKSRDPSPVPLMHSKKAMKEGDKMRTLPARIQASSSEYSEESESESIPIINEMVGAHGGRKPLKKTMSETSYGSEAFESETDLTDLEAQLDIIDEYYYGVRIFPGQDPAHVYVGWVTPGFHAHTAEFDMKHIRNVVVCTVDQDHMVRSR